MAGKTIRILPKTKFDFTDLESTGETKTLTVERQIAVTPYTKGVLEVRLHDNTFVQGADEKVDIYVRNDVYTDEDPDPADEFIITDSSIATVNFQQGYDSARVAKVASFYDPIGSMLALQVKGTRPTGTTGKTFTVTLSVDLVLRE